MSLLSLKSIPGYVEAVEREQNQREFAFTDAPVPLCGIHVRQLTLHHLLVLMQCENAFVRGGEIGVEDIAFFLWVISPDYCMNNDAARAAFMRGIVAIKYREAVAAINAFIGEAFMDSPGGRGVDGKSYMSFVAVYVDIFASEYGWETDYITHQPIARLMQLVKCIRLRKKPGAIMFNPSDRIITDYLTELNHANSGGRN